jgi:hypothetical protein
MAVVTAFVRLALKYTFWGLSPLLSLMDRTAVRLAADSPLFGEKTTLMVHALPASRRVPQVLVCEKSSRFVPLRATPSMVSVEVPVLVRVAT